MRTGGDREAGFRNGHPWRLSPSSPTGASVDSSSQRMLRRVPFTFRFAASQSDYSAMSQGARNKVQCSRSDGPGSSPLRERKRIGSGEIRVQGEWVKKILGK